MRKRIPATGGRSLFGLDAASYGRARPPYPAAVFSTLESEGALFPGVVTLEIGPGSGTATSSLLAAGANPVTLVEPDARFNAVLRELAGSTSANLQLLTCAFEDAPLADHSFQLVFAATVYHWLDPRTRVNRLRRLIAPGGHVALVWNLFQGVDRRDDFHEATRRLLADLPLSPSSGTGNVPFALDRATVEAELTCNGAFSMRCTWKFIGNWSWTPGRCAPSTGVSHPLPGCRTRRGSVCWMSSWPLQRRNSPAKYCVT